MILTAAFLCAVISVHDGDGFRCQSGVSVRLQAIDAPEVGKCPRNRVCAPGDGKASKQALSRMILGRTVSCRRTGTSYNRITAWCETEAGVDLSCAMVRGGWAIRWAKYDRRRELCRRENGLGLGATSKEMKR